MFIDVFKYMYLSTIQAPSVLGIQEQLLAEEIENKSNSIQSWDTKGKSQLISTHSNVKSYEVNM